MKRFYKDVAVEAADGGFQVALDGRRVKTQGGGAQTVPTAALAETLAQEWREQGQEIDPKSLPRRDLTDFALDQVQPDAAVTITKLVSFAETDTLCYRADPDEPAYRQQRDLWEPIVTACETREGVKFERVSGIVHRAQSEQTLATLRERLAREDAFTLAAMLTMASLAASLIIALAAIEDGADAEALFTAANAEEDWQAELWGWDAEAEDRRAARLEAFKLAAEFARLARG